MVHNSIFRGYNSIYHQAPYVGEADKADFVGYCLTWHKFATTHAENEEISLFPKTEELLEDKTIWEESHKEHGTSGCAVKYGADDLTGQTNMGSETFMPGIARFQDYLVTLKSPSHFSGTQLLEIMASFQEPLEAHFRSEISTIADLAHHPRTPQEGSADEKAATAAFDTRERNSLIKSGVTDVLPFFLFNFDREYEDGLWTNWPPIPGPVRWMLMSAAKALHPGWWKFASCDAARRRRALYAVLDLEREP